MKQFLTTLVILTGILGLAGAVWAQDFNNGLKAYQSGDFATALKGWRLLAVQGHARAQNNLGWMYKEGEGVTRDYAEAVKWYREAAEQGHARAQYNLGIMYANGEGVPEDDAKAVSWYRNATTQRTGLPMTTSPPRFVLRERVTSWWLRIPAIPARWRA